MNEHLSPNVPKMLLCGRRSTNQGYLAKCGLRKLHFSSSLLPPFRGFSPPPFGPFGPFVRSRLTTTDRSALNSTQPSIDRSSRGRQNHFGIRQTRSQRLRSSEEEKYSAATSTKGFLFVQRSRISGPAAAPRGVFLVFFCNTMSLCLFTWNFSFGDSPLAI